MQHNTAGMQAEMIEGWMDGWMVEGWVDGEMEG